ncbi:MAG: hypothetical protein A2Y97_01095 [Nitrospirae bacterium RBG_13_39_12]|nr:MAG: hypothetical protein A2Y97_01095 [Nitrospirae bacterium RBG_13_39_12]
MKNIVPSDTPLLNSHSFSDFAVIYRTNSQAKILKEAFISSGIPYQVIGEKYNIKRKELLSVLALLRALQNQSDRDIDGTIGVTLEEIDDVLRKIFNVFLDTLPLDEFLKVIWEESPIRKYCSEENFDIRQKKGD